VVPVVSLAYCGLFGVLAWTLGANVPAAILAGLVGALIPALALPPISYLAHRAGRHQVIYLSPSADVMLRVASTKRGRWKVDQHVKLPGADADELRVDVLAGLLPIARAQGVRVTLRAAGDSLAMTYAANIAEAQAGHPDPIELVENRKRACGVPIPRGPLGIPMKWDPNEAR